MAHNNKAWEKPLAHGASSSVDQGSQKNTEATWDHYLHISPDTSHCMEAVFSMVRKIYGRETEKLISGQTETTGKSLINFQDLWWVSTSFRLCALLGKNGRQSFWNPGRSKLNGIRTTIFSAN